MATEGYSHAPGKDTVFTFGGVVLGIEVEDDRLAAVVGELDLLATGGRELEVWGEATFCDHDGSSSSGWSAW
jgi:hypothetical protein